LSCVVFQELLLRKRLGIKSRLPARVRPTGGTNKDLFPQVRRCGFGARELSCPADSSWDFCLFAATSDTTVSVGEERAAEAAQFDWGPKGTTIDSPSIIPNSRKAGYHKYRKCHEFCVMAHCDKTVWL
jgi:hypothetical protein